MPWPTDKRVSDLDRERALRALRQHYEAGRIDASELEERAGRAARARTRGDLLRLFGDLPLDVRGYATRAAQRADRALLRAHVATYGTINGGLVGIWAVEGAHAFWPAAVLVPWTAMLGGHAWCSRAVRRMLGRAGGTSRHRLIAR